MLFTTGASQVVLGVKNPSANAGNVREVGSILGSGRSRCGHIFLPGEFHGQRGLMGCSIFWMLIAIAGSLKCSVQCSSVTQSCPTLWDPMVCSTPGFPVHHQLPEFTQTHIRWVNDAIHPSHPLSSPSPPTFNLSQHQDLFKWISSSQQVAKVLEFQLQHQSFQWIFRTDFLKDGLVGSPCRLWDSQESSPTPQFKSINFSVLSFLYSLTLTPIHDYWKNHGFV